MTPQLIYQRLLEFCPPYGAGGVWHELPGDAECFAGVTYETAVLSRLSDEFSERELIAAGIAKRMPYGLVMNPAIVGATNGIVALRSTADAAPYALLTSAGVLPREASGLLPVLHDGRTQELLNGFGLLLIVVFDVADLIILRSLGLPAATVDGLNEFTVDKWTHIKSLCNWTEDAQWVDSALPSSDDSVSVPPQVVDQGKEVVADSQGREDPKAVVPGGESLPADVEQLPAADRTDVDTTTLAESEPQPSSVAHDVTRSKESPLLDASATSTADAAAPSDTTESLSESPDRPPEEASPAPIEPQPLTLIFAGWSLARMSLDPPPELRPPADWLLQAARYLNFDISRIALWLPTTEDLQRIQFCLAAHGMSEAARLVTDSIDSSLFPLEMIQRLSTESSGESCGYLKAIRRHEELVRNRVTEGTANAVKESEQLIYDAIDRELVQPLIERAQTVDDPLDRNLWMTAAHVGREIHRNAVQSKCSPFDQVMTRNHAQAQLDEISGLIKLANCLRGIVRELRR